MRIFKDNFMKGLIYLAAGVTSISLIWIVVYILYRGLGSITPDFLLTMPKGGGAEGGISSIILITLWIVGLAVLISTPVGVCAAVYLVEYAKPGKTVRLIRFATESLSGIPSIIYGLFGMVFFQGFLRLGFSILSGALTVSIMVLPTVIRTTEEALKSVPVNYREGSLALGATKLRTIIMVILPCAVSGILASVILSIGRVVGETAALLLTAGTVQRMPSSIFDSGKTLAVHLYILAKEGISLNKAFATASVLIIVVALINLSANYLGSKLKGDNV